MAETKYTFSDDRGDRLEHYGVLGMKWGVRNADTQRKYSGGKGNRKKKTAWEKGYRPSKKSAAKAKLRYRTAEKSLSLANKQYKADKNTKNAKELTRAQRAFDEAKSHKEYVLSGKQAQNRARAARVASAIALGSACVLGQVGIMGVVAGMSNVSAIANATISANFYQKAAQLALTEVSTGVISGGAAAVSTVLSITADEAADSHNKNSLRYRNA